MKPKLQNIIYKIKVYSQSINYILEKSTKKQIQTIFINIPQKI